MKKKTVRAECIATAGAAMLLLAGQAWPDVDVQLTVATAYLHRGLEQSESAPVYQGSLEYQAAGWFAGVWTSNVSFGDYDERSSEIDYYLGCSRRWNSSFALEATVVRYTFQGDSPRDDDWIELQLTAYLEDRWTVTWGIADNWWATDATSRFVEGTYRYPLPARLILDTTVGYQLAGHAAGIDYGYAEAGLSRRIGKLVLRLGYAGVEGDARERFGGFADDRWVASLTWQP